MTSQTEISNPKDCKAQELPRFSCSFLFYDVCTSAAEVKPEHDGLKLAFYEPYEPAVKSKPLMQPI